MRHTLLLLAALCAAHVQTASAADSAAGGAAAKIPAWIAGCWGFEDGKGRYEEFWTLPAGDMALGVSRRVADGRTREFEYMRIAVRPDGDFDFIALPGGQAGATFSGRLSGDSELTFDNATHDFPQRIVYRYTPPDRLDARIEGKIKDQARRIDFPLRRRNCAP
ncbi:MAG: DUF6265 family protein [Solimonas sp.]